MNCKFCNKPLSKKVIERGGKFCDKICYWNSLKGIPFATSPESIEKRAKKRRGKPISWGNKVSNGLKKRWKDQEYRDKQVASRKGRTEEKCNAWKGENIGYGGIHYWLKNKFGKANKCENPNCKNISTSFEWAKLKGKKYERKRENFWMLCVNCHRKYDYPE